MEKSQWLKYMENFPDDFYEFTESVQRINGRRDNGFAIALLGEVELPILVQGFNQTKFHNPEFFLATIFLDCWLLQATGGIFPDRVNDYASTFPYQGYAISEHLWQHHPLSLFKLMPNADLVKLNEGFNGYLVTWTENFYFFGGLDGLREVFRWRSSDPCEIDFELKKTIESTLSHTLENLEVILKQNGIIVDET